MKDIILYGEIGNKFCKKISLDAKSCQDISLGLQANYPSFVSYVLNKRQNGVSFIVTDKNDKSIGEIFSSVELPCEEVHIHPTFAGGGGIGAGFSSFLGSFISTFALSWFMNELTKDKKKKPPREKIDTKSYIYTQNQNLTEQGSAVPLGYGQLRIGSKVVSASINNYDFDWKKSEIYQNAVQTTFRRIAGIGNIIDPTTIKDLRDSSFDPLSPYDANGVDKRRVSVGSNGFKNLEQDQTSESFNNEYTEGGGGDYGKLEKLGPSIGGVNKVGGNLGGAGSKHLTPSFINRPFLFPTAGIDSYFRPSGPNEPCVENTTKGQILGWKRPSVPMVVGNRQPAGGTSSTFQKLESVGVFRSVDILSEGPIGGFAMPITGLAQDNGDITYPFVDQDNLASYKAELGTLQYDPTNGGLRDQSAPFNNVSIVSPGSGFASAAEVTITVDPPSSSSSAEIGDISFNSGEAVTVGGVRQVVSNSDLFTLRLEDGTITGNANLFQPPSSVPFLSNQPIPDGTTQEVFDLSLIVQNQSSTAPFQGNGTLYSEGNGYTDQTLTVTVDPSKEAVDYNASSQELTVERQTQGKILDFNSVIDSSDALGDAQNVFNFISNRMGEGTPGGGANTWSEVARVYLDNQGNSNWGGAGLNATVDIPVATTRYRCGSGMFGFNFTRTSFLRVTLRQFLTLNDYSIRNVDSTGCGRSKALLSQTIIANYTVQGGTGPENHIQKILNSEGASKNSDVSLGELLRATNSSAITVTGTAYAANTFSYSYIIYDTFSRAGVIPANFTGFRTFANPFNTTTTPPSTVTSRYFKFGIGSGSNTNGFTDGMQTQALTISAGPYNDFSSVLITNDGTNPKDKSSNPRGLYDHSIYPRVTVFVLRYTATTTTATTSYQMEMLPTSIEAVAEISNEGRIISIQLLDVPDQPVWNGMDGFTPLFPQQVDFDRPESYEAFGGNSSYQDLGFYVQIDRSVAPINNIGGFLVTGDGTSLDLAATSDKRNLLYRFQGTWSDYIQSSRINSFDTGGAGFFNRFSRNIKTQSPTIPMTLTDVGNAGVARPTNPATYNLSIESINLNAGPYSARNSAVAFRNRTNTSFGVTTIYTGRPINLNMLTAGSGYTSTDPNDSTAGSIFRPIIYPKFFGITDFQIDYADINSNKGYKPLQEIYFYGYSQSMFNALTSNKWKAQSFKGLAKVDTNGIIYSVEIIDCGYTFSEILDADADLIIDVATGAAANGRVLADDKTDEFNDPNVDFPATPMILECFVGGGTEHIKENSIKKFFIRQKGLGFTAGDLIENPFNLATYTAPTFNVTLDAKGGLATVTIVSSGSGYSALDKNVELTVNFKPPTFTPKPPSADPLASYRSIYLNDVPVRDRTDRFNYAKFDYDFRIGDMINGNNDRVTIPGIVPAAINPLLNTEYRLPVYTKMIDYPLYGPRNNGDKDYFYSYTIRNSNATVVALSIKIHELYYVYEGDKMVIHLNLIPLVFAIIGFAIGTILAESLINGAIPEPVTGVIVTMSPGTPCIHSIMGTEVLAPITGTGSYGSILLTDKTAKTAVGVAVKAALMSAILGIVSGLIFKFVGELIPCSLLPWLCFRIGEKIENSGEMWPAMIKFGIEYGNEGEQLTNEEIVFRGISTSDYVKDIILDDIPLPEGAGTNDNKNRIIRIHRKSREMDPVSNGIKEARYKVKASLQAITEYTEGYFNYPNTAYIGVRGNSKDFPSIPKREYLLKLKLIKIPKLSHYNPRLGDYSGNWDGVFEANLQWSSNPAWVIYDLLLNESYGLGKYGVKEADLDKWSFYEFAKRADEQLPVVIDGIATTERRYMCNIYMDRPENGYEFINKLLDNYGCSLNWVSGKIFISEDAPKDAVMLFTNTNVSEEGFAYATTPKTIRYTACSVDYVDERDNYTQKQEYVEDFEGIKKYGYKKLEIEGLGVTRRGEAHRLAWNKILTRQLEKELIRFKAGIEASYLRQGDVIKVMDNKKISHHSGGRITKVINARNIELDIPTDAIINATKISIQTPVLSDDINDTTNSSNISDRRSQQYTTYDISGKNGFVVTLSSDLDPKVIVGYNWIVEENATDKIKPREYKIDSVSEVGDSIFEISAIEYIRKKYEYIDTSSSSADGVSLDEEREYYGHDIVV